MNQYLCPDCQTIVSEYASMCPTCGCPIDYIKASATRQQTAQAPRPDYNYPQTTQPYTATQQQAYPGPRTTQPYAATQQQAYGQSQQQAYGRSSYPTTQSAGTEQAGCQPGSPASAWHADWAQYVYESFMIMKNTFFHKFFCFSGRATRREFWSFSLLWQFIPLAFWFLGPLMLIIYLVAFFPALGVTVRRLHDNDHSAWWILMPVFCFFFLLQKSDPMPNSYGYPVNNEPLY